MEAKLLKERSINSVKKEIDEIETIMMNAAKNGELKVYVFDLSDAAKSYFKSHGYEVKLSIDNEHKKQWVIIWENC